MTYDDAVVKAKQRWGGKGDLHLFYVKKKDGTPYHMVGPDVDTLICVDDEDPLEYGEGQTWEQAFADFDRRHMSTAKKTT